MKEFPYNETVSEKEAQWDAVVAHLDRVIDTLGQPMDENIKEAVAALDLLEIPANSSCGGHIEENKLSFPYISGAAENEPQYRWVGEKELINHLQEKYNLTNWRDIFDNTAAEDEYNTFLATDTQETEEYETWKIKNSPIITHLENLLSEFRTTHPESKIYLIPKAFSYTLQVQTRERRNQIETRTREQIENEIRAAQKEFDEFKEFLKQKYFSEDN